MAIRNDELLARVGRRVAELREARCGTQQEFAERLGIANALEVDPAELFVRPASVAPRGPGRPRRKRSP